MSRKDDTSSSLLDELLPKLWEGGRRRSRKVYRHVDSVSVGIRWWVPRRMQTTGHRAIGSKSLQLPPANTYREIDLQGHPAAGGWSTSHSLYECYRMFINKIGTHQCCRKSLAQHLSHFAHQRLAGYVGLSSTYQVYL